MIGKSPVGIHTTVVGIHFRSWFAFRKLVIFEGITCVMLGSIAARCCELFRGVKKGTWFDWR